MRRALAIVATAALALLFSTVGSAPQAAEAAPYAHCDSLFNTPGLGMDCTVTIVNNLDLATGVTSSTTTFTECSGAANTALTCIGPTTVSSTELVTSVSQCNSSLDGGGGSMHCSVHITNNIVGDATAIGATVNQCNDSLGGGGTVLRACDPDPAITSGAAIDQCNNSANEGGASMTCLVTAGSTTSTALYVTVSQCNFSANGGGALIVCTTEMTTNITAAAVAPPLDEVAGEALAPTGSVMDSWITIATVLLVALGASLIVGTRLVRRSSGLPGA
ncbi:hypothetical protein [Pseudolysinimonas yzui]|uniref:LPXTG cell wall anchor domain-containing protein n=1 Tax=Pseudolysinimonas yzui TaxID=2708254 RepID=A0A8J3GT32_9MICO|nr:hypothetical protein [Pseudolysinimonas yzui]GHF27552.1 hypothetical protein GCM10011600_30480 [Pseudolysinimonas yzui]